MSKPPKAKRHSDIEGVHQDDRPIVEAAVDAGQSAADLERARQKSRGRPPQSGAPQDMVGD